MDIDNVWPDSLIYHSTDHQQQTYVTKHDLALLHKKIIATDLIVQKYQEANKALLSLQIDNDTLKQQNDQITNECCIFGKQVTECTQECDNLKEQIDILNDEKRELNRQLRLLQDQNTNFYHEIMILKQYESLKEINDESTKTISRQQKDITRLQLKLQRKSPIVYKPNKSKQEPSETDIALIKSQKSVRELKLALGRLVNFIQISKIEIPTSFHIRPVLKAHEINDDFLEAEGEFVLKPVTTKAPSIPVTSQIDDDDDDDEDDGDFIDVIQPVPVPPVEIIEEIPVPPKPSSQQEKKKKSRRITKKLDDLANDLEKALSKSDQQQTSTSHPSTFFTDDEEEDRAKNSGEQPVSIPISTPIILQQQPPTIDQFKSTTRKPRRKSTKSVSFLSDAEISPPIVSPIIGQQLINKETISSVQTNSITPIENGRTKYTSFLSEDDDDNQSSSTPVVSQQPIIDQFNSITEKPRRKSFKSVSFLSDDEVSPSIVSPIIEQQLIKEKSIPTLQVDSITPIENEQRKYVSFLSEDDDDNQPIATPVVEEQPTIDQFKSTTRKPRRKSSKSVSFLSDDEISPPIVSPVIEQQLTDDETISSSQADNVTPIENEQRKSISFLSEDDDVNQSISTPVILQPSTIVQFNSRTEKPRRKPFKSVEFLSDDEISSPIIPPVIEQQLTNEESISSLQVDSITSIENEQTKSMNFLGEDDDDNQSISTPTIEQSQVISSSPINQEYNNTILNDDNTNQTQPSDISQEVLPSIDSSTLNEKREISSLLNENDRTVSSVPVNNTLDSNRIKLVLRLLHVLTQVPKPLKPLRLARRRIHQKRITEEKEIIHSIDIEPLNDQIISEQMEENNLTSKEQENPTEEQVHIIEVSTPELIVTSIPEPIQLEQTSPLENKVEKSVPPPPLEEISKQSALNPLHTSTISRLLATLTTLPVKPLHLSVPFRSRKRKRSTVVVKSSVTLSRPLLSTQISRPPNPIPPTSNRMQTRSLNTIRACIARCNKPTAIAQKRTATESISPSPIPKRVKSTRIEEKQNEYDVFDKFITSSSKEMNDELRKLIETKLHDDISLLIDHLYRILSDLMIAKCEMILPLVKHLHPYEESIKILFIFINSKSAVFQHQFITKFNQIFEYEIKQKHICNNRIKILNRLYFLICSIFASSSIIIYARLFDIGCYLSHDILLDALTFLSNQCSSLISTNAQTNSSNTLVHRVLFDIFQQEKLNNSIEYLENLIISYRMNAHDQEDLIRSFVLVSRHQTWLWCSNELCSKLLFPLLNTINDQHQRLSILIVLQFILFIYKDNENFKQDIIFRDQIRPLLLSLRTMNNDECIVRDKIFFILQNLLLNK